MGKGRSAAPAPAAPDPYETASAESQFNRLNTYSPSGSGVRYGYTDAQGNFRQGTAPQGMQAAVSTVESPWERSIREMLQPASLNLTQRMVTDNINGIPEAARVKGRGEIAQQIFDRSFSMMAPAIEKANGRMLTNLQARGLPVGGAAFNDAMGEQSRQTQDTISRLAMDADINAGNEQTRQFGLDAQARQGSISEIMAAMTGSYNPPSATPSGSAPGVNYSGMVGEKYRADSASYQNAQASKNNAMATAGNIAGTMLMKCTETAKDVSGSLDLNAAVEAVKAMPLKVWRYKAGEGDDAVHVGPMAEDFQALTGLGDGKTINVIDALGVLFGALKAAHLRIDLLERHILGERIH